MRVAVVHDTVTDTDAPDARDVLDQAAAVTAALEGAGHAVNRFSCTCDLGRCLLALRDWKTDLVFNLVESIGGNGRLIHLLPAVLDAAGLPYTGARTTAMFLTSHKTLAKNAMVAAGIPTPSWVGPWPEEGRAPAAATAADGDWIVKSLWEEASIGLGAGSICRSVSAQAVAALLPARAPGLGGACFAERFIDGREFNLSLLGGRSGPALLPPAEIVFEGFGEDMPRIVDYAAKWAPETFAYHHTPRRFDTAAADRPLLKALAETALSCWWTFGLKGYARVDFRVDPYGRPWVLEVNANPCLSPDAGYAAALAQAGISFEAAVARIIEDAGVPPRYASPSTIA